MQMISVACENMLVDDVVVDHSVLHSIALR